MMQTLLSGLRRKPAPKRRARLKLAMADTVVYAVGDVHGCLDELVALERAIVADAAAFSCRKLIVMLGDYIDRGPASSQVLDHLIAPPPAGFERICLAGNHELLMLDYLQERTTLAKWIALGATATLHSYGIDHDRLRMIYRDPAAIDRMIRESIPASHRLFLENLPVLVEIADFLLVHAGIRPGIAIEKQADADLVSIRSAFYDHADLLDRYVVHGHTPVREPARDGRRVNIDTGAYFSGRLTALRIFNHKGRYLTN
ncbi:MAG TPA: metallophosphoesterase [Rhizobiaceae bacterium]|nr:metallophosphoesterase [Rhizobiaceae bacterium]